MREARYTAGTKRHSRRSGVPRRTSRDQYASASICGNERVVFKMGGSKYRLVIEVQYQAGIVWVKFVGTHAQYDSIDVESVNDY
jgi:mRNA interferase HigB